MIGRSISNAFNQATLFMFSVAKKTKMELTLRTPYSILTLDLDTVLKDFDGFSRIITKSNEAALVIQNRTPPAMYVLPPGPLKVRLTQDVKGVTGDFMHTGGWAIVHPYISLTIVETIHVKSTLWTLSRGRMLRQTKSTRTKLKMPTQLQADISPRTGNSSRRHSSRRPPIDILSR